MTSRDACTVVLTVASLQRLKMEALILAPADCGVVCDKVFKCTAHSADWNSSSAVPDLWPHMTWRLTHLLQEFGWVLFNHHAPYSPDLALSDFHHFLHLEKFLSVQHKRFQNDRRWVSRWFQSQAADLRHMIQIWSHGMTNVSIPEVNMLKNSSTHVVSVPINLFIKLSFVSDPGKLTLWTRYVGLDFVQIFNYSS